MLAVVHRRGEFGPARGELIGDMPPGLMRGLGIGLQKSLADRSSDHRVLSLRYVPQSLALQSVSGSTLQFYRDSYRYSDDINSQSFATRASS